MSRKVVFIRQPGVSYSIEDFKIRNPKLDVSVHSPLDDGVPIRKWLLENYKIERNLPYSENELKYAFSHLTLWRKISDQDSVVTVIESGSLLSDDFVDTSQRLIAKAPGGWRIIYWGATGDLGFCSYQNLSTLGGDVSIPVPFRGEPKELFFYHSDNYNLIPLLQSDGCVAYSITPEGARYCLENIFPLRAGQIFDYKMNKWVLETNFERLMSSKKFSQKTFLSLPFLAMRNPMDVPPGGREDKTRLYLEPTVINVDRSILVGKAKYFKLEDTVKNEVIFPFVSLLDNNMVGGQRLFSHWKWQKDNEGLSFFNPSGHKECKFIVSEGNCYEDAARRIKLIPLGYPPSLPTFPEDIPDGDLIIQKGVKHSKSKRKNLLIVRAGDGALYKYWLNTLAGQKRNWDLCVSYYGTESNFNKIKDGEYKIYQKGPKFGPLYRLFKSHEQLAKYEYFALLDDDLLIRGRDLNKTFDVMRSYRLEMAQPSLLENTPDERVTWPQFRREAGNILRYTDFVEAMMPFFSRDALLSCLPTFALSITGMGVDHVWPALLGYPSDKIGVVDIASAEHTRDVGTGGMYNSPNYDEDRIQKMFGVTTFNPNSGRCFTIYGRLKV